MTTTTLTMVGMPPARPFSSDECAALVRAGIIDAGEQADALAGRHRFTVDEYLAMARAGILNEDDRIELIDGEIIIMPPIGDPHEASTDWLTRLFVPPLIGRAIVRVQGAIRLDDRSAPQPDIALLRERPLSEVGPYFPPDVHLVIEVADSSLAYDRGAKLARYAAAGIPEVWVANLRAREVTSYAEPNGAEYAAVNTYRVGDTISPRAFPDVVLAVSDFMPPASETS
jgi:Uma2 family endonuclease